MGTARNMFPSKDKRDLRQPILVEDLIQYDDLNGTGGGGGSGVTQIIAGTNVTISSTGPSGTGNVTINASGGSGTVTGVTATGPITSSGGNAPVISTSINTNKLVGRSTPGAGVMEEVSLASGISVSGGTLVVEKTLQQILDYNHNLTNGVVKIGTGAGESVNADDSISIGEDALRNNNGGNNIAIGKSAGRQTTLTALCANNILIGAFAGDDLKPGANLNIAIGKNALNGSDPSSNIGIGDNAGKDDASGAGNNVFIGTDSGYDRTASGFNTGDEVVGVGKLTLGGNTGNYAVAVGTGAGYLNTGSHLVAVGDGAGGSNEGNNVIALGSNAGNGNVNGGQFIVASSHIAIFSNSIDAAFFFGSATLSTGNLYLWYDQSTGAINAYEA